MPDGVEGKLFDRRIRVFLRAPTELVEPIAGITLSRPQIAPVVALPPGSSSGAGRSKTSPPCLAPTPATYLTSPGRVDPIRSDTGRRG